jgi:hypothetical protein
MTFDLRRNLLRNPDLTANTDGWKVVTTGKTLTATPDGGRITWPVSQSTSGGVMTSWDVIPAASGQSLALSGVKVRRESGGKPIRVQIIAWTNPAPGSVVLVVIADYTVLTPLGVWTTLPTLTGVAPAATTRVEVNVATSGVGATGANFDYTVTGFNLYDTGEPEAAVLADVLRLEVERDPEAGELVNLIPNPSGVLGGYGWITSVAQSSIVGANDPFTAYQQGLKYISGTTVSPASNFFYAEQFPVAAGQWLAARWRVNYTGTDRYRVKFYWYNSAGSFIGETANTNFTASYADHALAPVQAPANTAYASILFEMGTSSGAYPYTYGGTAFSVRDVTVCKAATSGALSDLSGAVTTPYVDVIGTSHDITVQREELDAGTLSAVIRDATIDPATASLIRPGRNVRLTAWAAATGTFDELFAGEVQTANVTYDIKRRRPDDPKHARITLTAVNAMQKLAAAKRPEGVTRIADLPFVLEGAGVPWVCDGNSGQVPSATLASTNDNASAVDQVALTRDTALGYAWVDRRGVLNAWTRLPDPDVELVQNKTFDVNLTGWFRGGAGATPTLARDTVVKRTGTASARLTAATGQTSMWTTTVDTSTTQRGALTVTPGATYEVTVWVRSGATSRTATLWVDWWDKPGTSSTFISTSGDDYNVGTTTTVVGQWTQVTKRVTAPKNATAADVTFGALTPSGTMPSGEQHWFDDVTMKAVNPVALLDEDAYSEIDLSFDTTRCINSIDMKWLVHNTFTGETDEYALSGYEDAASVGEWGRHHKTFTIHGSTANAAALAASVFSRNAVPTVRPNSVTLPIRTEADLTASRAFLDLYDLVRIVNTDKGVSVKARVTSVRHRISPFGWLVDVGFAPVDSVAMPQALPPVQNAESVADPYTLSVYSANGSVGAAFVDLSGWTQVEGAGIAIAGATFTVSRPGRYLLQATVVFDAVAGAGRAARFVINGTALPYDGAGGGGTSVFTAVGISRIQRLAAGDQVKLQAFSSNTVNVLGGTSGYGQTRCELVWMGD